MTMIHIERAVEIHENERCWIGKGFSAGGLLPNDRGGYSTFDGSISWKTLPDASEALLTPGWQYADDTDFAIQGDWMYARDFSVSAVQNAKPTRNPAFHWVRFRCLTRRCIFCPNVFASEDIYSKCDHGDSRAIETVSQRLLQVLAYCTLVQNTSRVTDAVAIPLKTKLLELLIQYQAPLDSDAFYQLEVLCRLLQEFAVNERQSRLFCTVESFHRREEILGFSDRCNELSGAIFPPNERNAIAGILIRKLDQHYQLHCSREQCGAVCEFRWEHCPNKDCQEIMSQLYLPQHDETCPFKLVACACGDSFPRHKKPMHLTQVCPLREAKCPFGRIGCSVIVQAQDLPNHVAQEASSHLLLVFQRMTEHEDYIKALNQKIQILERENAQLKEDLTKHKKESTTAHQKLIAVEKRLGQLETSTRKEFNRVRDRERERERAHVK